MAMRTISIVENDSMTSLGGGVSDVLRVLPAAHERPMSTERPSRTFPSAYVIP